MQKEIEAHTLGVAAQDQLLHKMLCHIGPTRLPASCPMFMINAVSCTDDAIVGTIIKKSFIVVQPHEAGQLTIVLPYI